MATQPSAVSLADRLIKAAISMLVGTALIATSQAQARPGQLDPSFSGDGRVTTQFVPQGDDIATAVAVQQDRRIVAVGLSTHAALSRYLPGGSLDPSFGKNGRVKAGQLEGLWDVAIDTHERIVVAGTSTGFYGSGKMLVARFVASGELDDSFADHGIRRIEIGGDAQAQDLELERGGGIIVAGRRAPGQSAKGDFAVVKLTPKGALDQSFANGGVKLIDLRGDDSGSGVDVDRSGRITVGGTSNGHASFARLKPSGHLDRSFSGNGRRILERLRDYDEVSKIAVKRGGGIVATGTTYRFSNDGSPTELDMFLASLHPDGSLNRSFGHRGRRTIDLHRLDRANDLALQADGKIVVAGMSGFQFAVLRLTRHGRLDSKFSGNGKTLTRFQRHGCYGLRLTLQPNGKIVVAGYVIIDYEGDWNRFALARYRNDGLPADG